MATKRSLFIQASTLQDSDIVSLVGRAKADPEIKDIVLAEWDIHKASVVKSVIPFSISSPYKHLFVGNPAPVGGQDYRLILNGDWRWANLVAAEEAAKAALPYADGWYINYETGLNVFESEAYRAPWEWYLGDMVRRLRRIKDVPFIWSPYLFGSFSQTAIHRFGQTMQAISTWYSPGVRFEVHVQDGVGAHFQTQSSALRAIKAMQAAAPNVKVKVNAEWFDVLDYTPVNAEPREDYYRANGLEVGACWEIRYWNAIQQQPATTLETLLRQYVTTVSLQPRAGEAPDNRLHSRDTSGPYYVRQKYTWLAGQDYRSRFGLFSLGQWRALSVLPTAGSGRSSNSDHYSGGAYDFGGPYAQLLAAHEAAKLDKTVAFSRIHGTPLHLHVSFKLEGDLP